MGNLILGSSNIITDNAINILFPRVLNDENISIDEERFKIFNELNNIQDTQLKLNYIENWFKTITCFKWSYEKFIKELEREKVIQNNKLNLVGLNITNYIENVEKFHKVQPFFYDNSGLFWFWDKHEFKYKIYDDIDILNSLESLMKFEGQTTNQKLRSQYLDSFKRVGRKNIPLTAPITWVQLKDKIFDIENNNIFDVTPKYFFTNPIPQNVGEIEDTPTLDKIFSEWVGERNIVILYEIISYCLVRDYPIHRIFCFVGSGNNGKTCFLRLLNSFVGSYNCTSTELDTLLNSRFEVTKLHKKLICLMGETDFTTMKKTSMLKKLSGQDQIGFEYKNKNPFEDVNYAKITIATNNLPITDDKTRGFYRRWLIIDFPNEFNEKKDILKDIPLIEYDNLTRKCLRILKELLEKREFTNEGSIDDRQRKYEEVSNILGKFILERCYKNVDGEITFTDFYSKFCEYCRQHKHRVMSGQMVGKLLGKEGFERVRKSISKLDDISQERITTTIYVILGLKFKEETQSKL